MTAVNKGKNPIKKSTLIGIFIFFAKVLKTNLSKN